MVESPSARQIAVAFTQSGGRNILEWEAPKTKARKGSRYFYMNKEKQIPMDKEMRGHAWNLQQAANFTESEAPWRKY
eukprot:860927-Pyramimonas_sp.AAC.1